MSNVARNLSQSVMIVGSRQCQETIQPSQAHDSFHCSLMP